jgi:hypothetical protein
MTADRSSELFQRGFEATPEGRIVPAAGEDARVRRIRWLAKALDGAFRVPGTNWRFGWDQLIGLMPGAGDVLTGLLAVYLIVEAARLGVPRRTLARMAANVVVDVIGGAMPVAGDLFDFAFKANRRNLRLVERYLEDAARRTVDSRP